MYKSKDGMIPRGFIEPIIFGLALIGTLILLIVILISTLSIFGRLVLERPIVGDFELVEMGCAVAIFLFLPLCHFRNGNISIDVFTMKLDRIKKNFLDRFATFLFLIVASFFSIRMVFGLYDMLRYQEQTMLLQIPIWIPFVPAILSFFALAITSLFCMFYNFSDHGWRTDEWID